MHVEKADEMTEFKGVVHVLKERASVPPPLLYKYCPFNDRTPRIFENNELYFQSPNDFNDPFDSIIRFSYKGSRQQRKRLFNRFKPRHGPDLSRKELLSLKKRFADGVLEDVCADDLMKKYSKIRGNTAVCCMTEKRDHILMWSHYAGQHSGFCLEFQTEDDFVSSVHPVSYSGTLPCVNVLLMSDWNKMIALAAEGLLTKAEGWAYEHEWRIIDLEHGAGWRQFPPKMLHGVILGCRIPANDRQQMVEWCKGRSPRPILYRARKKKMEYGLDIEPIPY